MLRAAAGLEGDRTFTWIRSAKRTPSEYELMTVAAALQRVHETYRQRAIIETVFADLIDGARAHIPSGRFGANSAWVLCAAVAHNLLRAVGVLAGDQHTRARGSPLRSNWIAALDRLAALRPKIAVAGHKKTGAPGAPSAIADSNDTCKTSTGCNRTPQPTKNCSTEMTKRYPAGNPTSPG